jgi:flavin-binding protein dodecin
MSSNVYRVTEIVGSSTESSDAAIRTAIARANETVRNLEWFEVVETRGHIENGAVAHFQVTLKVGFRLDGDESRTVLHEC